VATKEVRIYLDPLNPNEIIADPDPVSVSVGADDQVEWLVTGGEAEIEFKGDSPFPASKFQAPRGGSVKSGKSRKDKVRKDPYKYWITFRVPDDKGGPPLLEKKKDPEVIIEP
jgi:hypothetical protein